MSRLALLAIALGACWGGGSCRGEEGRQVAGAVEDFVEFGMSNEERPKAPSAHRDKTRPHLPERSREIDQRGKAPPTLRVDVDMPHQLSSDEVVRALDAEADRLLEETPYPVIKIRGLPGGLLLYGKVMGETIARREKSGEVLHETWALVRDDAPVLNDEQHEALVALELECAALGKRGKNRALKTIRDRFGRELVDGAVKTARTRWSGRKGR